MRLGSDLTCVLEAEPIKLNVKDANLAFYLAVYKFVTLRASDYDVIIDFRDD